MYQKKLVKPRMALFLLCALLLFSLMLPLPAFAYADDPGEPDAVTIRITPPSSANQGAVVEVRVTDNSGAGFSAVYVKTNENQDWRDMAPYLEKQENNYYGAVELSENCTVYVRVNANDGKTYEKSRYVECFGENGDALYSVEPVPQDAPGVSGDTPKASTALTPDGQGTVVDDVTSSDDKEFYTITTPAENVFYLVIDKQRDGENVYFLNAVTEADLLALAVSIPSAHTKTLVSRLASCVAYYNCSFLQLDSFCTVSFCNRLQPLLVRESPQG